MAKPNACIASSGRARRSRRFMTPAQIRAYLLARETLRRLGHAAALSASPPTQVRE